MKRIAKILLVCMTAVTISCSDSKALWTGDDVMRIASISKSFVATGILQLVEGALDYKIYSIPVWWDCTR